jgi:hypothetical protein
MIANMWNGWSWSKATTSNPPKIVNTLDVAFFRIWYRLATNDNLTIVHGELEDNCAISLDILCKHKKTKLPTIKM